MTEFVDGQRWPATPQPGPLKPSPVLRRLPPRTDLGLIELFERFPLIKFGWDTHHGTVTMHMPVEAADVLARAHPDPYRIESAVFELEKAMRDNWWPDVNVQADLDDNR